MWIKFLFALFLVPTISWGAACCGGSSANAALITTDDKTQLSLQMGYTSVPAESLLGGEYKARSTQDIENRQNFQISAATLLSDRWQAGASVSLTRRFRSVGNLENQSIGISDPKFTLGFEALPEWDYSAWRPKIYLYSSIALPLAPNAFDSNELFDVNSRSRGYLTASLGALILKNWGSWDVSLGIEFAKPFSRTTSINGQDYYLSPSWQSQFAFSLGYSPDRGSLRLALNMATDYLAPITLISNGIAERTGVEFLVTPSLAITYLVNDSFSIGASYSDQTLLRVSDNTALSRTLLVSLQTRFPR